MYLSRLRGVQSLGSNTVGCAITHPFLHVAGGLDDREAALDAALVAEDDEVEVEAMLAGMMSPAR